MKGIGHSDSGILKNPTIGVALWFVGWICIKHRESSIYTRPGCPSGKIAKTPGINRKSVDRHVAEFQPKGASTDQAPTGDALTGSQDSKGAKTTPKNMATAGRLSGLLIQAFKTLGCEHVTKERVDHLKRILPLEKRRTLLDDLGFAPAWMRSIFTELAEVNL